MKLGLIIVIIVVVIILIIIIIWYFIYSSNKSAEIEATEAESMRLTQEKINAEKAQAEADLMKSYQETNNAEKTQAEEAARIDAINKQNALETYGFYPTSGGWGACRNGVPPGSYGFSFDTTKDNCKEMGGAWNAENDGLVDCHMNTCLQPNYGFGPYDDDSCPIKAYIATKSPTCIKIGGRIRDPMLPDDAWGACEVSMCPFDKSKYAIAKHDYSDIIGKMRMSSYNKDLCSRIGGVYGGTGELNTCITGIRQI